MRTNSISEKISINQAAKRQADLLNDIQKTNQAGSWEWEPGTDHYFWTDSMFYLHGLCPSSDNMISIEAAHQLIHPDDFAHVQHHWEELHKTGTADYYFRIVTPGDKIRKLHARGKTILTEQGLHFYRGSYFDQASEVPNSLLDEIKRQAIQINILERAEQIAQMGTWQINLNTYESFYSDNIYRLYGLEPGSLNPHPDTFRKFIHPDDRDIVVNAFEKSYQEKIPLHLEYRIVLQDEEERYIKQVSSILKNEKGEQLLTGTTHDITEKKWLELAIKQSYDELKLQQKLFQETEQIGATGTWQINVQTREAYYSDHTYTLHGLKPQSLPSTPATFLPYIHPDDRQYVEEAYAKILEGSTAPVMEYRIVKPDGRQRTLRQITKQTINGSGESVIIGVIQDITEPLAFKRQIKDINQKLLIQNEFFVQAEKIVSIGNWFWNLSSGEINYSDNIYQIYGVKPPSLPNQMEAFIKFVHPDDRELFTDIIQRIKREEPIVDDQYRIILSNGELRFLRNRNKLIISGEGEKIVIGTLQDITREVELQHQLSERIDFAEMLSDTILDTIIVTDTANNIIGCNKQCEKILGFKKDEIFGKNIFNVFPQFRNDGMIENFRLAYQDKTIQLPAVSSVLTKGYHDLLIRPLKNKEDQVIGVLILLHDVTEEYHLRRQLQIRLSFIENLVESSIDRIMVLDNNLNYVIWNRNCESYYGIKKEEIIGKNVLELFPKFKSDPIYQDCKKALQGESVHIPVKENNTHNYSESFLIPIKNEKQEVTSILWIIHDLSEIMPVKEKLVISETLLKTAQEIAHLASWEYDHSTGKLSWSDEVFRIYGYEPRSFEPGIDFYMNTSHAGCQPDIQKLLFVPGDTHSFINKIYTIDGRLRYIQTMGRSMSDSANTTIRVIGTMQDITEQKVLRDELQEKTKAIRNRYDLARQVEVVHNVCTWQWNIVTDTLFWSENVFRILGYAPYSFEPTVEKFIGFLHPDDKAHMRETIDAIKKMQTGPLANIEYRVVDRAGKTKYLRIRGRVIKNSISHYITGTIQDITDYELLRLQLIRNNQLLERIIDTAKDAISIYDNSLHCLIWNDRAEEVFGISKDDATGKMLFDIIPQLRDEKLMPKIYKILDDPAELTHTITINDISFEASSVAYGKTENTGILLVAKHL